MSDSVVSDAVEIRDWRTDTDDLTALTALIHLAYGQHKDKGLQFLGTYQSPEDTRKRIAAGHAFVATLGGQYVGTITVRPPKSDSPVMLYRDSNTWTIGQFAVDPALRGQGLGKRLHDACVRYAHAYGGTRMALDTAAPAIALQKMYETCGYIACG